MLVQYCTGLPLPRLKHVFWLGVQMPVDLNASLAAEQISSSLAELKLSFSHYELLEALTDRCMNRGENVCKSISVSSVRPSHTYHNKSLWIFCVFKGFFALTFLNVVVRTDHVFLLHEIAAFSFANQAGFEWFFRSESNQITAFSS